MNDTIKNALIVLDRDFSKAGIDYCIIGGMAMWPYNCERSTIDIDTIVSRETAPRLREMTKLGYLWDPDYPRSLKMLTDRAPIMIDVLIEGFSIEGVETPSPVETRRRINGIWFISIDKLIDLKSRSSRSRDQRDAEMLAKSDFYWM